MPVKLQIKEKKKKVAIRKEWDRLVTQLLIDIIKPLYGGELANRAKTIHDVLHDFFNVEYREVYKVRFNKPFRLYGEHWLSTFTRSINTGARNIKEGQEALLRVDTRDRGAVDIQIKLQNETDQIFSLTAGQWDVIKKKCTVVYKSILTGKEATRARHLKKYHSEFVKRYLGCGFEYRTTTNRVRPNYKGTKA